MKKQLLALALVASAGLTKAQTVLWSQDFNSTTGTALPAGWLQNNVDGLTPDANVSAYNFGTNAWVTRGASAINATFASYGRVVCSTSWYSPVGTSNDWLITPQFTASAGSYLQWDAITLDGSFPDGYQVLVSTTGTTTASFTNTLFTIVAENSSWTPRSVSLNSFSNQAVYVAFRNNSNDKFILLLDNIQAVVPAAIDGAVTSVTSVTRYMATGNVNINGLFKNNGSTPATSAVLNYKVDGGAPVTQTFTFGSAVNYNNTTGYSFATTASLTPGQHTITVEVTHVNGVAETNTVNNVASVINYVATSVRPRNVLIEGFTSSTCGPCASNAVTWDPLLNGNNPNTGGTVNVIRYQMNWPGTGNDPGYNPHGLKRRQFYNVSGIPDGFINGKDQTGYSQAVINAGIAEAAWVDVNAALTGTGTTLAGTATITPAVSVAGPVRIFQALVQQYYNYPGAATSQKNYYHSMRIMNPNGGGTPMNLTAGSAFTVNFNHTANVVTTPAQNSYNFWSNNPTVTYAYVVFAQDTVSKDVLNSGSSTFSTTSVGMVKMDNNQTLGVYPNPAQNFAIVAVKLENATKVSLAIYDITGKVVYTKDEETLAIGQNEIMIDTEKFAAGAYTIVGTINGKTFSNKLIIAK